MMGRLIRYGLSAWFVLLLLSTGFRAIRGFSPPVPGDLSFQQVAVPRTVSPDGRVRLAYRSLQGTKSDRIPLLFLHGNPVAGAAMLPLARELPPERSILIPDLPGLGHTDRKLNAFSAENQAQVLLRWLDDRGIRRVHLVAYSQGGTTALALSRQDPERVASISLVAAVGVQEHELLGRHDWNQPLYRAYQGFLIFLRWGTPHFGFLDQPAFAPSTARNFAETDLRPNRKILETLSAPLAVFHSPEDLLVPFRAARTHAALAPNARLFKMSGGHLGPIREPASWAAAIRDFIDRVETGNWLDEGAPGMAEEFPTESPPGNAAFLIAVLLFLFVFFSEDLACLAGGLLAAGGLIDPWLAISACFAGIWVSDLGLYLIGRFPGGRFTGSSLGRRLVSPATLAKYRASFQRRGLGILFATRFLPGSRVVAYLAAGLLRYGFLRFALVLAIAGAVWTPLLVGLAFWLGSPILSQWETVGVWILPLGLVLLLSMYALHRILCHAATPEGRRRLRERWLRMRMPEFWPTWIRYLPVVLQGFPLAIRYRGALVWTSCNPGMSPLSGLATESKSEILSHFADTPSPIARWQLIPVESSVRSRFESLSRFQESLEKAWPIVLKPDLGERGKGVSIVRNRAEAERKLRESSEPLIAQAYIEGPEFGVFYYRFPHESRGRIFSITEKILPEVEGDGLRTLEELILSKPRGAALATQYLSANSERLGEIPSAGEKVRIAELGTHRLGAVFLDGNRHRTPSLEAAVDAALRPYEGFYFGRLDVRASSAAAFRRGEDLRILEINGVSSESTDLYDPKHGALAAWRILLRQWRLAFAIGAANRAAGAPPARFRDLVAVLRRHRHGNRGREIGKSPIANFRDTQRLHQNSLTDLEK